MNARALAEALGAMARLDGVLGCALVDADTGMAWHSAGTAAGLQPLAEAASDYWRLFFRRRADFGAVGELRAQVLVHAGGRITLVGCGPRLLLMCLSEEPDRTDWQRWKLQAGSLQNLVASF